MDPLSMTASIIAILKLTTTLTDYLNDVKNASKEQAQMAVEASNMYSLLTSLRFRVEAAEATRSSDAWLNQVKLLGQENGPLDQFKRILEELGGQISSWEPGKVKSALKWRFTKTQVDDALKRMERLKTLVQCALTGDLLALTQATHNDVRTMCRQMDQLHIQTRQLQKHVDREVRHRLAQWLGVSDPSTNYQAALRRRHPDTGLWLINGTAYTCWKNSSSSLMWLHGNAGCGKTVLSAAALQDVLPLQDSQPDTAVAYFYFDFNDIEKQSSKKAIRSLLFQVALHSGDALRRLQELYQRCGDGQQQPSNETIRLLLQETLTSPGAIYIVLDALDECTDREDLLNFLTGLINLKLAGLRVLATSRREREIEVHLQPVTMYNINIQSAIVDDDIRIYIQSRLDTDLKLKKWPGPVRNEISNAMMEKAHGMFRWVYCQLESIRHCVNLRGLRKALRSLPKTLDETYDRIIRDLESRGHLEDAITVLRWLCFSDRPFRLAEMVEVLAVECGTNGGFWPEQRLPDPADVIVVCSSLISYHSVTGEDGHSDNEDSDDDSTSHDSPHSDINGTLGHAKMIRLAHFSVKEYLLSDRCRLHSEFQPSLSHQQITEGCLHYLLYTVELGPLTEEIVFQQPLAQHAAEQWWRHAREKDDANGQIVVNLALRLLTDNDMSLLSCLQLCNIERSWAGIDMTLTIADVAAALYYAAFAGLADVVRALLAQGADVNAQGGSYSTALQAASAEGHEAVVQTLLAQGADVNAQGGSYSTALQAASVRGHEAVVQTLLAQGADVNAQGGSYSTALQAASVGGHEAVVQTLLAQGADVNAQGGSYYSTALQAASVRGHEAVVQTLLAQGADVNAQGGYYGNALQAASAEGHEAVVQTLLAQGADVNAQGGSYSTALQAASVGGHEAVVQTLLAQGADVNAQGGSYSTALQAASVRGHEAVVQTLLAQGADVNAQGGSYSTALQAASVRGHKAVVQTLLAQGADVNAQGSDHYSTALQAASVGGHEAVVQTLLAQGADVNAQGGYYGNALQAASAGGHEAVVQTLLAQGADINAQGGDYGTTLQAASAGGHEAVVQTLLAQGADVSARGGFTSCALWDGE